MKVNIFEGTRRIALLMGVMWVVGCIAYAFFQEPRNEVTYAVDWPDSAPVPAERCSVNDASQTVTLEAPNGKSIYVELCLVAHRKNDGKIPIKRAEVISDEEFFKNLNPKATVSDNVSAPKQGRDLSKELFGDLPVEAPQKGRDFSAELFGDEKNTPNANFGEMLIPYAKSGDGKYWLGHYKHARVIKDYKENVGQSFQLTEAVIAKATSMMRPAMLAVWKDAFSFLFGGLIVGWMLIAAVGWIVRGFMGIPQGKDARPSV
jgi:hypothetical protein